MLLPQELKNYSFSHAFRGYTAAEVEEYIRFLIDSYEKVYRENQELSHKLVIALQSLDEMHAREGKLAALEAEMKRVAARLLAEGERKQAEILADAECRRRQMIDDAAEYADRIVAEADAHVTAQEKRFAALQGEIAALRDTLFAAYSSHIDQVEAVVNEALAEKFTDPAPPASALAEIAEEIAPAADTPAADEAAEAEEDAESDEDVYTPEELTEKAPAEAFEAPVSPIRPADYDEDVYSEEELHFTDIFAPQEAPAPQEMADAFFTEAEIAQEIETATEEAPPKESERVTETFLQEPAFLEENDDARLLQDLYEAFDKGLAEVKTDTAPAEDEESLDTDAEEDEWLAALKRLENVISSPTHTEKKEDDAFTFVEETEDTADTGRHGLFGHRKPKDR